MKYRMIYSYVTTDDIAVDVEAEDYYAAAGKGQKEADGIARPESHMPWPG